MAAVPGVLRFLSHDGVARADDGFHGGARDGSLVVQVVLVAQDRVDVAGVRSLDGGVGDEGEEEGAVGSAAGVIEAEGEGLVDEEAVEEVEGVADEGDVGQGGDVLGQVAVVEVGQEDEPVHESEEEQGARQVHQQHAGAHHGACVHRAGYRNRWLGCDGAIDATTMRTLRWAAASTAQRSWQRPTLPWPTGATDRRPTDAIVGHSDQSTPLALASSFSPLSHIIYGTGGCRTHVHALPY